MSFMNTPALNPVPTALAEGFLGGEALGIGSGLGKRTARRLGPLYLGKDALFEPFAETVERIGWIRSMLQRSEPMAMITARRPSSRASARTGGSSPSKIASPIRKWPMLSSASCGIAAMGWTLS
jgi:hypothetical protein